MKYQIVVKSKKIVDDQTFEKTAKGAILELRRYGFELVFARSLDGIREEVWNNKSTGSEANAKAAKTAATSTTKTKRKYKDALD